MRFEHAANPMDRPSNLKFENTSQAKKRANGHHRDESMSDTRSVGTGSTNKTKLGASSVSS